MLSLSSFALALPVRSDCLLAHSGLRLPSSTYFMATSTMLIILREGPNNYTPSGDLCHAVLRGGNRGVRAARYFVRQALQPAPYPRAVAAIDVPELAFEIGFLAGDHTVADDKRKGCQRHQQPEAVERNSQADEPQHHAEIDGIAREAVGSSVHD